MNNLHKWQIWLLAARPRTLPASMAPVLVGTSLAFSDGRFSPAPALAALVGALLLQLLSNFANDYFDFQKGADTRDRLGPVRVMAAGLLTARELRLGIATAAGLAVLDGLYLVLVGGWPVLAVGIASLLAAVLYTGGPFPYGYHGLGDLFVFIFFGLAAVCGTYYVQAGTLPAAILFAAVPVGLLITAILVVNNLRDIETDAQAGKRTLAVRIGPRNTRRQYLVFLILAYAATPVLWLAFDFGPAALLPLISLPFAARRAYSIFSEQGKELNAELAATAQLSLQFSLLLSLGILL
ncbi:MAG: 1,4-dihydroxy-2-naphthoate polyprenyltransferase [Caldilineaceae bacterium SB0670_bin_27]|uniref:1,4-dihydroxy-2-naphthoate octaprenyltransferase n=1 Tax=Caldilineaceae bacterium SB0664_bin_27 TaxID=2605260 RepID=A0A6B0YQQ8_9CHLR|nr:1,4-dihydroxy-2-naphthoate polyprenyltransferase [Caldilineaceae bacterium]MXY92309.1 1,4-dihydroxy-2-naphthoate polyprenyltransferase [Caldilineaceae bacterium SB0664_bin_27]MYJ76946.1 1,4-dihydroxy-2-naphthoate polyprenyltransferase [Caldilineaceae bacterium SB0670_bin_27]